MKSIVYVILAIIVSSAYSSTCHAASVTYGETIDIDGGLKILNGQLCFPDFTCQSTALVNDGSAIWGQITGLIENQTDLQVQLSSKQPLSYPIYRKHVSVLAYTPTWQTQGDEWVTMPEFDTPFVANNDGSYYRITYNDNIGIYSSVWCTVGIFIDDLADPICYGSWTGTPYNTTFNQQTLTCDAFATEAEQGFTLIPAGQHVLHVKHKSTQCVYGNYVRDRWSTYRSIQIQELN